MDGALILQMTSEVWCLLKGWIHFLWCAKLFQPTASRRSNYQTIHAKRWALKARLSATNVCLAWAPRIRLRCWFRTLRAMERFYCFPLSAREHDACQKHSHRCNHHRHPGWHHRPDAGCRARCRLSGPHFLLLHSVPTRVNKFSKGVFTGISLHTRSHTLIGSHTLNSSKTGGPVGLFANPMQRRPL